MRIAVPSDDGVNPSAHFGKCREFLVFEAGEAGVTLVESRANGGCHSHGSSAGAAAGARDTHSGFAGTLRGCDTVLCGGIGAGAVAALQAAGIAVVRFEPAGTAAQTVAAFRAGALAPATGGMCQCQH